MSTQPHPDQTLSEISHLFLSSVRQRQTGSAPRPQRRPPAGSPSTDWIRREPEINLTAEEVAQVVGEHEVPTIPVSALLGAHLGERQVERCRQYAAHLAASGRRVGLIEVDASELRILCFERAPRSEHAEVLPQESLDGRRMTEALHELAHDTDQWLVVPYAPRANEARALLRQIADWLLLASCRDDGIVEAYRTLKGLADAPRGADAAHWRPSLSLALLDAGDAAQAHHIYRKFAGVCEQFLHWPLESFSAVTIPANVNEQMVLWCRGAHDKAQLATAPQWQVVAEFIQHLKTIAPPPRADTHPTAVAHCASSPTGTDSAVTENVETPTPAEAGTDTIPHHPKGPVFPYLRGAENGTGTVFSSHTRDAEVLDLPETTPQAIARTFLGGENDLVACPIHPPMCPHASLAVSRERKLVLIAVARQGLSDLRDIGRAYRWLIENRPLIGMAVPQLNIDAEQLPRLHLLVEHADVSAEILQPMLESDHVTVQAYRRVRWSGKTGLLLEAA